MNLDNSVTIDPFEYTTKLSLLFTQFAEKFNYPSFNESFFEEFAQKFPQKTQTCCRKIDSSGGWTCLQCRAFENCIICNECFINGKDKHKNHQMEFRHNINGFCDCGDSKIWDPNGFCPNHTGPFQTDEEINNYLLECFHDKSTINIIEEQISSIVSFVFETLLEKNLFIKTKTQLFSLFFNNIFQLCDTNNGILHIVSNIFLKQHVSSISNTSHKCYYINELSQSIDSTESDNNKHPCICCYISLFFRFSSKADNMQSMLILFQKNFKIKMYMGLLYFQMFPELVKKDSLQLYDIGYLMVQHSEINIMIVNDDKVIEWSFTSFINYTRKYLEMKNYDDLWHLMNDFNSNVIYLLQRETANLLANKTIIYTKLFDLISLIHNVNYFEEEYSTFRRDGFNLNLLFIEFNLLDLVSKLIGIIDFTNEKEEKKNFEILLYLISKISNKDYYILKSKEYSFHIILYRTLSALIIRFAYGISVYKKMNFNESIIYIMKAIPNYEILMTMIYKDIMKCLGFIISTNLGFWNHYSETMITYYKCYTDMHYFFFSDFAMLKIIQYLSIENCKFNLMENLLYSQVKTSYNPIKEFTEMGNDFSKITQYEDLYRDMKFNSTMLKLYLLIICDNSSIWKLFIQHLISFDKKKIEDSLIETVLSKERERIKNIIKQELVTSLIVNRNSASYSQLVDSMNKSACYFVGETEIEKIINEISIHQQGYVIKFSVKDEYLSLYDSSLILNPSNESYAQECIMNFKSKQLNILNMTKYSYLQSLTQIQDSNISQLCQQKNIELLINIWKSILINHTSSIVLLFVNVISKYLIYVCSVIPNVELKKQFKLRMHEIFRNANQNNFSDELIRNAYEFVNKNVNCVFNKENGNDIIQNEKSQNINNDMKLKKKSIMNKYKKKFIQLNNEIKNKFSDEITEDKKEDLKQCVICRCSLNENEEIFGYFGYITYDYLIHNMIYQTSKEIINSNKNTSLQLDDNKEQSIRIYSCNHCIHFSCFENLLTQHIIEERDMILTCPLCKYNSNSFIPIFPNTYNDDNKEAIIRSAVHFIENVLSIMLKKEVLIIDFQLEETFKFFTENIGKIFYHYMLYIIYETYGDELYKKKQILLLSTLIKAFKIIIEEKKIEEKLFIELLQQNKHNLYHNENIGYFINEKPIELLYSEWLLLSILLNKDNSSETNLYFFYYALNIYIRDLYINNNFIYNKDNFDSHFNINSFINHFKNNISLNKLLSFNEICKQISSYSEESITLTSLNNSNLSQYNIKDLIKNKSNVILSLKEFSFPTEIPFHMITLSIPIKFSLISLPNNFQEIFTKTASSRCSVCNKSKMFYYICLICGELICLDDCKVKIGDIYKKGLGVHMNQCTANYGVAFDSKEGTAFFIFDKIIMSFRKLHLYRNKYGEMNTKNTISNQFEFSKEDYEKLKTMYFNKKF